MKATIPAEAFRQFLSLAAKCKASSNFPPLHSVRAEVPASGTPRVILTVSNLDVWVRMEIPATDAVPGVFHFDRKELAAAKPDKKSPLTLASGSLAWTTKGLPVHRAATEGCDPEAWPHPPATHPAAPVQHLAAETIAAIATALPFASTDETRYVLCGAYLEKDGTIITTNGRMLYKQSAPTLGESVILPTELCKLLIAASEGKRASVRAIKENGQPACAPLTREDKLEFHFLHSGVTLISTQIQGWYPNYRQVIPSITGQPHTLRFTDTPSTLAALANLPKKQAVTLTRESGRIRLQAGDFATTVPGICLGEMAPIAFNRDYLIAALTAIPGGHFTLSEPGEPGVLRHGTALVVVMPMRIHTQAEEPAPAEAAA